ncbi:MAG: hypothetical protein U9Q70_13425 [Chloroflexota bacterium]|nr:hypothetical protein [Chloroflexota bacterium]
MKRDFFAQYDLAAQSAQQREMAVDYIVGKTHQPPPAWPALADVTDFAARLSLLAAATGTPQKDYARVGRRHAASGLLYWYTQGPFNDFLRRREEACGEGLSLLPTLPDLAIFPRGAWALQFTFRLSQPYLSRDDTDFYILDNPVKKEWVFKLPYVAPSQWKGALRAAMSRELASDLVSDKVDEEVCMQRRLQLYRLFGNEKNCVADFLNCARAQQRVGPRPDDESQREKWEKSFQKALADIAKEFAQKLRDLGYRVGDVEGFQGRLHFYPTYFTQIGLEVLNPHPRATGAGQHPLYFECVPQGAEGMFTLLYVPFDRVGEGKHETRRQMTEDLAAVAKGVRAMMTLYGFGAKTSSGFGVAEKQVKKGALAVAMTDPRPIPAGKSESPTENPLVQLEADMADFVHRFQLSDFPRWTNAELKASDWGRKRQSKYKRLRRRHPDWNESTRTWQTASSVNEPLFAAPETPPQALTTRDFDNFTSLVQQIRELAQATAKQPGGTQ